MKKGLKRILAILMSMAVVLSGVYVGDSTVKAETNEMSIANVKAMSYDNDVNWRFDFNMNGTWPTTSGDAEYLMDDITVTIRDAQGTVKAEVKGTGSAGEYLTSFKSGSDWILRVFSTHTAPRVAPVTGDTLTISSGQMVDKADATKNVNFAKEQVLQWDGAKWSVQVQQTVAEMSIASVASMSYDNDVNWRFDFNMNGTWPTTKNDAEYLSDNLTVTIRDAEGTVKEEVKGTGSAGEYLTSLKGGSTWILRVFSSHTAPRVAPVVGDTITISSGQMVDKSDATKIVKFTKEQVFQWDGTKWSVYIAQTVEEMSIASVASMSYDNDVNWRFDFNMNGTWPTTETNAAYLMDDITVTIRDAVGNVKVEVVGGTGSDGSYVTSEKGGSLWLLRIFSDHTAPRVAPVVGDTLTISSGQMVDKSDATKIVNFAKECTLEWNGTAWEKAVAWTPMTITGLNIDTSVGTSNWNAYFYTDVALPGESWGTVNDQVESYTFQVEINGVATTLTAKKADGDNMLYVAIPLSKLPQDKKATITFKAGKYKSNVQAIGYQLTEDVSFYTSEYGCTLVEDAFTSDLTFDLNVSESEQHGGKGFVVTTNKDDGVTPDGNWNSRIYAAYKKAVVKENQTLYFAGENGVSKNGVYQAVKLNLVKLSTNTYYVDLAMNALTAEAGDCYTVGGVFIDEVTGKFVEYEPIRVRWTGTTWEKLALILDDTGVLHDVNADGKLDVKDLVRMKTYMADDETAINAAQLDINSSGAFDEMDVVSLRKVLAGLIRYDEDGQVYGVPTYNNSRVIDKVAYACPSIGTLNKDGSFASRLSDEEIDEKFQEYKAAGFTLLNSEFVALYRNQDFNGSQNEPLRVYLEAAERNGLGVIVYSEYLESALKQDNLSTSAYKGWESVVDFMIANLKSYPAFRGFMMSDELGGQYAENYQLIATWIKENYPDLILFSSQLPIYGSDINGNQFTEDTYKEYIEAFGPYSGYFTYDNYALYQEYLIYGVGDWWYQNLKLVAEGSLKEDGTQKYIPGITIQAARIEPSYYAPEQKEDIGFQVYTSLAWGMQSINYFAYEDHPAPSVGNEIQANSQVRDAVTAVNAEVDKLAPVFKSFAWKGTLDIEAGKSASTIPSKRLTSASATGARALVGCMKDADGFDGYMIANAAGPRTLKATKVTLNFNNVTSAIVYDNGEKTTVDLTDGSYTFTVGVGKGIFVIPICD